MSSLMHPQANHLNYRSNSVLDLELRDGVIQLPEDFELPQQSYCSAMHKQAQHTQSYIECPELPKHTSERCHWHYFSNGRELTVCRLPNGIVQITT